MKRRGKRDGTLPKIYDCIDRKLGIDPKAGSAIHLKGRDKYGDLGKNVGFFCGQGGYV